MTSRSTSKSCNIFSLWFGSRSILARLIELMQTGQPMEMAKRSYNAEISQLAHHHLYICGFAMNPNARQEIDSELYKPAIRIMSQFLSLWLINCVPSVGCLEAPNPVYKSRRDCDAFGRRSTTRRRSSNPSQRN